MQSSQQYRIHNAQWICLRTFASCLTFVVLFATHATGKTIARCGEGWLEQIDGVLVLHLQGTPYEMGYQHGALLKDHCVENCRYMLDEKPKDLAFGPLRLDPRVVINQIVAKQKKFVPQRYFDELQGIADASGVSLKDIRSANFIPELFHCSGFAVMNSTTKDGVLYHGRVLDYATDSHLQDHAVIVVAKPNDGIPFVNITYAGFIGSVTGMNAEKVAIGEMGGLGIGHWSGVPMAILMREVIQSAKTLDEAVQVFHDNPRTCVYYYVVSDGKTNRAIGMATNWKKMVTIGPGESHPLLPTPVKDAVLISADERYKTLVRRVKSQHGTIDADAAMHLMDQPVATNDNLHNVLFEPATTRFWVAQASKDEQAAATQPYKGFQLTELLQRKPDATAKSIRMVRVASRSKADR